MLRKVIAAQLLMDRSQWTALVSTLCVDMRHGVDTCTSTKVQNLECRTSFCTEIYLLMYMLKSNINQEAKDETILFSYSLLVITLLAS